MPINITNDTTWINPCFTHGEYHEHVSVYLIETGDQSILIDSGSFLHRDEIRKQIVDAATNGIDTIILSHSDYPHSGNIRAIRNVWNADLVASSGSPDIQGLPDARQCKIGDIMTIEGREFSFIDPPLADRSHTTWIYDHADSVLYTADGFGSYHRSGDCAATAADLPDGISDAAITAYHADNLGWLRYVDPVKLEEALDSIFEAFHIDIVAPIHGHPIGPTQLDTYRNQLIAAVDRIASEYTVSN